MYRYFTKTDGLKVYIKNDDILAYEEMEDHVLVITVIGDFEVVNTIEEIFEKRQNFSNN
jgi:uncharacterized protein with ACT and thioredoxin-like domain